jgi:hypothetical protein
MTDNERIDAHAGSVAAPGHEEALAELAAENERLRAGLQWAAHNAWVRTGHCPHGLDCSYEAPGGCATACYGENRTVEDCWGDYFCLMGQIGQRKVASE